MENETQGQKEKIEITFRGFDDEFNFYYIGSKKIPIKSFSYATTKIIKELSKQYNEALKQFEKGEINDFERIDKQDEYIESVLKLILTDKEIEELFNDDEITKPSLFGFIKDVYSFLQVVGSHSEVKHLQTLLGSMTTN